MSNTNVLENFVAGGVGGICAVATGHPFDTIKVRLQTMPKAVPGARPLYTGASDCVKQTVAKEGFMALYKGMAAPIAGVAPIFAIFFGGCAVGRWLQQKEHGQQMTFIQNLNAGALAGVLTTVIMVPGERIKCLLQVQSAQAKPAVGGPAPAPQYNGPIDVVKKLYREGGIRSIYRGTAATLLRDVPASGAYLAVFEFLKLKFSGGKSTTKLSPMASLMAGGFAGMANWAVCIPQDVLKSRLQTAPHGKYPDGIRGVLREILREEGPRALFKGFTPIMARAFPANAACFLGFDFTMSLFKKIQ